MVYQVETTRLVHVMVGDKRHHVFGVLDTHRTAPIGWYAARDSVGARTRGVFGRVVLLPRESILQRVQTDDWHGDAVFHRSIRCRSRNGGLPLEIGRTTDFRPTSDHARYRTLLKLVRCSDPTVDLVGIRSRIGVCEGLGFLAEAEYRSRVLQFLFVLPWSGGDFGSWKVIHCRLIQFRSYTQQWMVVSHFHWGYKRRQICSANRKIDKCWPQGIEGKIWNIHLCTHYSFISFIMKFGTNQDNSKYFYQHYPGPPSSETSALPLGHRPFPVVGYYFYDYYYMKNILYWKLWNIK